ncbi:MAG: hypothetical protein H6554_02260 [Chitinophagales bacterium]|nr:hypothetical protein [Chitinophagales bacterium]
MSGLVFFILTWLFVGIYRDAEFYEPYLFIKYRPTPKIIFYSPTGMSDLTLDDLSKDKQTEEIAFQEFVYREDVWRNRIFPMPLLSLILIQLTLTLFSLGILKGKHAVTYKQWHLPIHFAIGFIPTSISICLMLTFDNLFVTIIGIFFLLAINYASLILLTKNRHKKITS